MKICIDAGHGVETAGKCSPDRKYFEHEFNLDVANRTKAYLEANGIDVVMTRVNEHDITLSERCKICNSSKADILISIHTNAAINDGWHTAEGWQAYILAYGGNAEVLANKIKTFAIPLLGCKDRGIFKDNLALVRDTKCPAVIIEHGFHTNKKEVEALKRSDYRQMCAKSNAMGICAYFGVKFVEYAPPINEQEQARKWAVENKISDGTNPDIAVTRSELWTMLYRMNNRR